MDSKTQLNNSPTGAQKRYLRRGLNQPGGKLPLFDEAGRQINPKTIQSCLDQGWARLWFKNPIKSDWLVCRLTERGREIVNSERKKFNYS